MNRNPDSRPPGPRGEKGDQGEAGVPRRTRRSIVILFAVAALVAIAGLARAGIDQSAAARIRCESLAQIVAIPVPVPVTDNPSREWVYRYVMIQRRRGEQLGCKLPAPRYVHVSTHS